MNCSVCGHSLSFLSSVLAGTASGTQCTKCWNHLSNPSTSISGFDSRRLFQGVERRDELRRHRENGRRKHRTRRYARGQGA